MWCGVMCGSQPLGAHARLPPPPNVPRAACAVPRRVLVAAMVNLPDQLVSALLVLSMVPAPFTADVAEPLLALADTQHERLAILRRLVTLGFLGFNVSLQQYSMHKMVREAAQLLLHNLGGWAWPVAGGRRPRRASACAWHERHGRSAGMARVGLLRHGTTQLSGAAAHQPLPTGPLHHSPPLPPLTPCMPAHTPPRHALGTGARHGSRPAVR